VGGVAAGQYSARNTVLPDKYNPRGWAYRLRQRVEDIGGDLAEKSVQLKHKSLEV
jgi:hypothetical protein